MTARAQIHRFGDKVAIWIGTGETVYLTSKEARAVAKTLNQHVKDIAACTFANSTLASFHLPPAACQMLALKATLEKDDEN